MAGPKRIPWKNMSELKAQYREQYWTCFFIGAALSWPLAILVGRRASMYQGGVAVVPYQRCVHDHPNVHPTRTTFRFFRRYALITMFVTGTLMGRQFANDKALKNNFYNRPDFKPKAAMVMEQNAYDEVAY